MRRALGLTMLLAVCVHAAASPAVDPSSFAYLEHPGAQVPLDTALQDSEGRLRALGSSMRGLPLILVPGYFNCPNLCSVVRASLLGALRATGLRPGRDYTLAVLSIDPHESSADARQAKARDVESFDVPGSADYWNYWTGKPEQVRAINEAVGFRDRRDAHSGQFVHPAGIVFLTPKGVVSSYLLGVGYTPAQVRSAIERARTGELAARGSPLLLLCFHFDEATGRYSLEIMKLIRLAGLITVLTLAGIVLLLRRAGTAASRGGAP